MQKQNTSIRIEYFPLQGVSCFKVPNMHQSSIPEVKRNIDAFLESVKKYKILHVILNFSQTDATVGDETFRLMLDYLIIGLKHTGVNSVAWLPFTDAGWAHEAAACFSRAPVMLRGNVRVACLKSLHEAKDWLQLTETIVV
jgi:hypothetical protein